MNESSLLIVGSIGLDEIKTPFESKKNVIGGSTTYSLIAASNNISVSIVGIIGNDFPDYGHQIFQSKASNLDDLQVVEGKTFRWGGLYHENWDDRETLYTELGVFSDFQPILTKSNKNSSHIFLANIHPDLQKSVIEQNENNNAIIVVDTMNLWIDIAKDSLLDVLSKSNFLLLNESEAYMLTDCDILSDSASIILDMGLDYVVIKKGSSGLELFSNKNHIKIEAYPVKEVVDPTGAGDTFGGGFISALASGKSKTDALIYGSSLASICVEGFGPEAILNASEEDINHRINYLKSKLNS